jgi:hypothetical protein
MLNDQFSMCIKEFTPVLKGWFHMQIREFAPVLNGWFHMWIIELKGRIRPNDC